MALPDRPPHPQSVTNAMGHVKIIGTIDLFVFELIYILFGQCRQQTDEQFDVIWKGLCNGSCMLMWGMSNVVGREVWAMIW